MKNILQKYHHTAFRLLLAGIILFFLLIMTSFSFPDLFAMFYVPHFVFSGNIYTWVVDHKAVCPWVSATWPPLYYYTIGAYLWLLETFRLFPTHLLSANSCPVWELITDRTFLFWAKLPFLLSHIATAWLFSQFFTRKKRLWFLFWLLNPIALFVNFMQAQFDSLPILFFMLSLYFGVKKHNPTASALALGIGGAFKHYPFLLVIPFTLLLEHTPVKRLRFVAAATIPYLLLTLPEMNKDFLDSLLFTENQKMFQSGITLGNVTVSYYVLLYLLFLCKLLFEKKKSYELLISYSYLFSSIYFITTPWFSQRLLFLVPTMLLLAKNRKAVFHLLPLLSVLFFIYTMVMFPGLFDHTLLRPVTGFLPTIEYTFLPLETIKTYTFSAIIAVLIWFMYVSQKETFVEEEYAITGRDVALSFLPAIAYLAVLAGMVFIQSA